MFFVSHCQSVLITRVLTLALFAVVAVLYYKFTTTCPNYNVMDESLPEWIYYSREEVQFPIAYGMYINSDYDQFYRLFKSIYRPFNLYCINADLMSNQTLRESVLNLTKKYPNVIVPKKFLEVNYSSLRFLDSELLCIRALDKNKLVDWKYFFNVNSQEWPLKTNLEIVRILRELKGANLVEKLKSNEDRFPKNIGPPPHKIIPWKGAHLIIATRPFIKFALYNKKSQDLLAYLRQTFMPEESFFSTLNHDHKLRAPGGYSGNLLRDEVDYPFLNRHKIWQSEGQCYGEFIDGVCAFSMEDVPAMIANSNMKFFAARFIKGVNDDVLDFMERWLYKRSRVVYSDQTVNVFMNLTYYQHLTVVDNHY